MCTVVWFSSQNKPSPSLYMRCAAGVLPHVFCSLSCTSAFLPSLPPTSWKLCVGAGDAQKQLNQCFVFSCPGGKWWWFWSRRPPNRLFQIDLVFTEVRQTLRWVRCGVQKCTCGEGERKRSWQGEKINQIHVFKEIFTVTWIAIHESYSVDMVGIHVALWFIVSLKQW